VNAAGTALVSNVLTNGQLLIGSTGAAAVAASLTGTTNQVNVTNGAGSITLSTPQDIHTAATPTFASTYLTAVSNQMVLGSTNTTTINATAPASSRTYTIPDTAANSSFVMTDSAQTVNGIKTFTSQVPITATTNQVILGNPAASITITAPAPAASRTYTIPDAGGNDSFALLTANQAFTNKTIQDPTNNVTANALFSTSGPNGNPVTVNNGAPAAANYVLTSTSTSTAQWMNIYSFLSGSFNTCILNVETIIRSTSTLAPDYIAYFTWLNVEYNKYTNIRVVYDASIALSQKIVLDVYNINTALSLGASGDITVSAPNKFNIAKPIADARLVVRGYKTGSARSTVISLTILMDG
jgi:hypothetical protein